MALPADLGAKLDLHLWKPGVTREGFELLCALARQHHVRAVCVPGSRVQLAAARLEDSHVQTVALIGFPLGSADADVARFEIETAIDHGAQEIEAVINTGRLRDGDSQSLLREFRDLAEAAEERPVCLVLETTLLTRDQIILACHLALDSGITAISNATGYLPPSKEPVAETALLREALGPKSLLKCADISYPDAIAPLLQAGATRIGTSHLELLQPTDSPTH